LRLAHSFDYFVGNAEQGRRNREAEHPGGLRVHDQLELIISDQSSRGMI
jgi:hypothetical protein